MEGGSWRGSFIPHPALRIPHFRQPRFQVLLEAFLRSSDFPCDDHVAGAENMMQ